jgi:hypothetical protein
LWAGSLFRPFFLFCLLQRTDCGEIIFQVTTHVRIDSPLKAEELLDSNEGLQGDSQYFYGTLAYVIYVNVIYIYELYFYEKCFYALYFYKPLLT